MKKILLGIFLIVMCFSLTGCNFAKNNPIDLGPNEYMNIYYDGKATNTSISFTITENQEKPNTYGEWYEIEKLVDNVWLKVTPINTCVFDDIGLQADNDKSIVFNIDWEYCYGSLDSGEYRIVKYYIPYLEREATEEDREYFYVEFTID